VSQSASSSALERLPPARRPGWRTHRIMDQVSIYLPILLMGLMAMASYWLLRITPSTPDAAPERAVTHEPDYVMRRFSIKTFHPNGELRSEIFGSEARHHPDTDTTEIDQARIRSIDERGLLTTATARLVISNGAQTEFVLEGDAVVVREGGRTPDGAAIPRMEFQGERLRVYTQPQRLVSDQPVTLLRGNDRLRADSLDYQGDEGVALFKGRVKGLLSTR
jgi:lipopolysaccharide export system protein LptC